MTYRDESDASLLRRDALERSLRSEGDLAARERIADALAAVDRARRIEARRHLPLVAQAKIASPCHETFEAMSGEGAIRNCARCDQQVFDLAQMTLGQAEALIASRGGGKTCVRLRKRADGTMMFADCEVGARGIRTRRVGAAIAGVVIAGAAAALLAQPPQRLHHTFAPPRPIASHGHVAPHLSYIMGEMTVLPAPMPAFLPPREAPPAAPAFPFLGADPVTGRPIFGRFGGTEGG